MPNPEDFMWLNLKPTEVPEPNDKDTQEKWKMIQLDEHHWIKDADEVKAIRPKFISPPDSPSDPNRRQSIIDPEKCMVLIGDNWHDIDRGTEAIARLINSPSS